MSDKQKNLGHMVGFFVEDAETVFFKYSFEGSQIKGDYQLMKCNNNFYWYSFKGVLK